MLLNDFYVKGENLFKHIKYFKNVEDVDSYWLEFICLYGNNKLLKAIEGLYLVDGIETVGSIFNLKSEIWGDFEEVNKSIKDNIQLNQIVKTIKEDRGNITKTGKNVSTKSDSNSVIPFDIVDEVETDKSLVDNTISNDENILNQNDGDSTTEYLGFNNDKINFLYRLFNHYPDYRYRIYKDIVNMICLQVY